jgi:hypothetical protein
MPDEVTLDRWPELKTAMRKFSTRHRIGMDDVETEHDLKKRLKRGVQPGYRSGMSDGNYRQNFDFWRARQEKYRDYAEMAEDAAISGALDIYADEATQADSVDHHIVKVEGDDEDVNAELERLLFQVLRIDSKGWDTLRRLVTYGDAPFEIKFRKDFRGVYDIQRIDHRRFDRQEENGKLVGFKLRQAVYDPRRTGKTMGWAGGAGSQGQETSLNPFRVIHWRLPDGSDSIYGRSIMEAARRTWRQVRLMEDSIVIYRISRGAERRVFYVNVGNLAEDEAEGYIRNLMAKFRKKSFINPRTGEIDEKANPLAWDEDFYIPIQDNKDNTRIEQLPGGQNMGEIEDLKWFRQKIDSELKIPSSYLSRDGNFDTKAGLSQQDIRFSRTVERVQRAFIEGLNKICYIHLMLRGFSFRQITSFTLRMTPPSALAELLRLDAMSAKLEIVATARSTEVLPDIYILTEIMGFGEDEANELLQLKLQQDQQKAQAEAAAQGAAGGGGAGLGGMGAGGAMPSPGGEDVAGGSPGAEGGGDLGAGVEPGAEGAAPPPGGAGTPEMASVTDKRKPITEMEMRRKSIKGQYKVLLETYGAQKKGQAAIRQRHSSFEHACAHGELGGLTIKGAGTGKTLNEALANIDKAQKLLSEAETEQRVAAEMKRLLLTG